MFIHYLKMKKRLDLSRVFIDQEIGFDHRNLRKSESVTVNRTPVVDSELSNRNYVDELLDRTIFLTLNLTF